MQKLQTPKNTPREISRGYEYGERASTPAAAMPMSGVLYKIEDKIYVFAKNMKKIAITIAAAGVLAGVLVAGIIGLLLGQPITLFPRGRKP